MPLPFVVVRSAASFILTYMLQSYFGNLVDVETIKSDDMQLAIRDWSLKNAVGYVLLSNIYAAGGNKHLCEYLEQQGSMEKGVKKL